MTAPIVVEAVQSELSEPRQRFVQGASPAGLHRMACTEWGDSANPRVLLCVHGLTRSGRDFDRLAQAFSHDYRVVCPDVVGRGLSDWLADPGYYGVAQYVADMVTLVARLNVETVDWFGTSMGGLIGMALGGLPNTPVRKMLLNDVGPHIEPVALQRVGEYLGKAPRFASLDEGVRHAAALAASFGPLTDDEWTSINTLLLHEHVMARGASATTRTSRSPSRRRRTSRPRPQRRSCGIPSLPSRRRCWSCAGKPRTCCRVKRSRRWSTRARP